MIRRINLVNESVLCGGKSYFVDCSVVVDFYKEELVDSGFRTKTRYSADVVDILLNRITARCTDGVREVVVRDNTKTGIKYVIEDSLTTREIAKYLGL